MATYDDLVSVLNNPNTNPLGLSLADALAQRNFAYTPPSAAETKEANLNQRLQEKQERLAPGSLMTPNGILSGPIDPAGSTLNSNLLDVAESSLYRSGGNLADAARGISNKILGTGFDDSEESGWSNQQIADNKAGVSLAYRNQGNQKVEQVFQDIQEGNWWEAAKSTAAAAPFVAADSASTVAELGAGAVLAPLGAGLVANRAAKASKTAKGIIDKYNKLSKSNKTIKGFDYVAGEAGKASLLTADIVQQQRNEYKAANGGKDPSGARLAGLSLLTLATTIWQPSIAAKLFIPKALQRGAKAPKDVAKAVKSKDRKALAKMMQDNISKLVAQSERGIVKNLAIRVGEGVGDIAKAGGAEAVQEYAQFWAETLGVHMKPDEMGGFMNAAAETIKGTDHDKALQAAFLGAGAGGVTRAAVSAPGVAVGSAVDSQLAVANNIRKFGEESAQKEMSKDDFKTFLSTAKRKTEAAEKLSEKKINSASDLTVASKYEEVKDKGAIAALLDQADGKDLTDPEVFASVKSKAIGILKGQATSAKLDAKAQAAKGATKVVAKRAAEAGENLANNVLTEENVKSIKNFGKATKEKLLDEVKNFPESATLGLIRLAEQAVKSKGKKLSKAAAEQARTAGEQATRRIAAAIKEDSPEISEQLLNLADKQAKAAKANKVKTDKLHTKENLNSSIKQALSVGVNKDTFSATVADLQTTAGGEFDSASTVKTVRLAMSRVQNSVEYNDMSTAERKQFNRLKRELHIKEKELGGKSSFVEKAKKEGFALSSIKKSVLDSADKVFKKFMKDDDPDAAPVVVTDGSSTSKETIPVHKKAGDTASGVVAVIPITKELKELAEHTKAFTSQGSTEEEANALAVELLSNPSVVPAFADRMGTTDSNAVYALMAYLVPEMANKDRASKYIEVVENTLKAAGIVKESAAETETETSTAPEPKETKTSKKKAKTAPEVSETHLAKKKEKGVSSEQESLDLKAENKKMKVIEDTTNEVYEIVGYVRTVDENNELEEILPICKA